MPDPLRGKLSRLFKNALVYMAILLFLMLVLMRLADPVVLFLPFYLF